MDIREKLVELVRSAHKKCKAHKTCHGCEVYGNGSDCVYMFIADHLIANGVTVQEWKPVTERLPDETKDEYVLVVCDYYGKIEVETRKMWHIDSVVTHWMPLPSAPKGE